MSRTVNNCSDALYVSVDTVYEEHDVLEAEYELDEASSPTAGSDLSTPRSKASSLSQYPRSGVGRKVSIPTCPLCKKGMTDPVVVAETGHSYDRDCIEAWLASHSTCPVSGKALKLKVLMPNYIIRDIINQGLRQGPQLVYPLPKQTISKRNAVKSTSDASDVKYDCMDDSGSLRRTYRVQHTEAPAAAQPDADCETIIELLTSDPSDLAEEALHVLLHVMGDTSRYNQLVSSGVVVGLVSVLQQGTDKGQTMSIAVLTSLAEVEEGSVADVFLDAGVIQCLVTLLLSPSLSCQVASIGLLAKLSARYAMAMKLVDEGGLSAIVQLLFGMDMECKELAVQTLANVARHEDELLEHLAVTADALKGLVPLLRSGNPVCQEHVTYVLVMMSRSSPQCEAAMCRFPVIDPLVQLLWFTEGHTKLYATQLLALLCSKQVGNCNMVSVAGGAAPLLKMLMSPERSHQVAAGELLVYLERVKDARKDIQAAFKSLNKGIQRIVKKNIKALRLKLKL